MKRKPKPTFAYAAVDLLGFINPYWIRAMAKDVRGEGWERAKKMGYRVRKVRAEVVKNGR